MKTSIVAAVLFSVVLNIHAQNASHAPAAGQVNGSAPAQDTPYAIVRNDANSRTWERTTYEQLPSGEWAPRIHRYEEVATGLNFMNPDTGQWEESSETIEPVAGGAVARRGQHKVIFAADVATFGAVDMETPDGQRLRSHLLGLCYYDRASGKSVFIAEITNSIGQLISANQVWYDNAFTGVRAGVRYTYTREGFEQDVILEERPPAPEAYGLNSATTVLQAFTEFISPPVPTISMGLVTAAPGDQLVDETLSFSAMTIGRGRAFLMGDHSKGSPVAKKWTAIEGRQFLIEEVSMPQISEDIKALPPSQDSVVKLSNSVLNVVSAKRLVPPQPMAKAGTNVMNIAGVSRASAGFVLDYSTLNTTYTNPTFWGSSTYYLPGNVNLYGTNITFEGGSVFKYASNASLTVNGPVNWQGRAYRPVVMIAKDDDTCGEIISGSTANPGSAYYASRALCFNGTSAGTNLNIQNLRIVNARAGLVLNGASNHVLTDIQLVKCCDGIAATNTDFSLRNALFDRVLTNFSGSNVIGRVEHLTVDTAAWLNKVAGTNLFLTNCLLVGVTNFGNCYTDSVATVSSSAGIFQTAIGGYHYLATDTYRNRGTINISSTTLELLNHKTTYPPVCYSNITFTNIMTFDPQAQRDTDNPDLGYHYDPLDYVFGGCTANSNFTFSAGTAVGWFRTSSGTQHAGYGISIADQTRLSFNGVAATPDYWVRLNTVQERDLSGGYGNGGIDSWVGGTNNTPVCWGEFLRCSAMASENGSHFQNEGGSLVLSLTHSEIYGSRVTGLRLTMGFTNCLLDRVLVDLNNPNGGATGLSLQNCTGRGVTLSLLNSNAFSTFCWPLSIRNCAFDGISIGNFNYYNYAVCPQDWDYNAYPNASNPFPVGGSHDQKSVTFNWQVGPLGRFYLPANSALTNAGYLTADQWGLYHFTTQTNQVKETNSVVDIGYHYVALNAGGSAIDTDGDGLPDYLEDANGNGIYDAGDPFDWRNADADGSGGGTATFTNGMSFLMFEPKPTSQIP